MYSKIGKYYTLQESEKETQFLIEERIGRHFREAREKRKLSIKDVENSLKIRSIYLEYLEEGGFNEIVPEVYLQGFIRSYASFLDFDAQDLWDSYLGEKEKNKEKKKKILEKKDIETSMHSGNSGKEKRKDSLPSNILVVVALVILTGVIYVWHSYTNGVGDQKNEYSLLEKEKRSLPDKKIALAKKRDKSSIALTHKKDNPRLEVGTNAATQREQHLEPIRKEKVLDDLVLSGKPHMKAIEEAWVAFENANSKRLLSKNMKAGEVLLLPEGTEFIVIGNAGGANLLKGNQQIRLGRRGEVRRHSLKKLFAQIKA